MILVTATALLLGLARAAWNFAFAPRPFDHTSFESDTCEVHHIKMSKRQVPIAYGMIPMSRVEAEQGEWKQREDCFPHPGDCMPSVDIVMPGDNGQAVVYVCPKCEAAKREYDAKKLALQLLGVVPASDCKRATARWLDLGADGRIAGVLRESTGLRRRGPR